MLGSGVKEFFYVQPIGWLQAGLPQCNVSLFDILAELVVL